MAVKQKRKPSNMKGMTIGRGMKRPTKSGAGLTKKGVAEYRKQNKGSKLQTAVTEQKPTGKRAARRKSYCARSAGQMKKFPKAAKNPNSRLRQARKRWRCQLKKITPSQKTALTKHSKHHSKKHMSEMRTSMRTGKSFGASHRAAMKKVGK